MLNIIKITVWFLCISLPCTSTSRCRLVAPFRWELSRRSSPGIPWEALSRWGRPNRWERWFLQRGRLFLLSHLVRAGVLISPIRFCTLGKGPFLRNWIWSKRWRCRRFTSSLSQVGLSLSLEECCRIWALRLWWPFLLNQCKPFRWPLPRRSKVSLSVWRRCVTKPIICWPLPSCPFSRFSCRI